jgi:hypothetical protein
MPAQITNHARLFYSNNVLLASQQMAAQGKLFSTVMQEGIFGEKHFWDTMGTVEFNEQVERAAPTTTDETPRDRRAVTRRKFFRAELFDEEDDDKVLRAIQPESALLQTWMAALGRKKDDLLYEALMGTALTGKDGTTSTAFDATPQTVTDANALTSLKLRAAKAILDAADIPAEGRICAVHPIQLQQLLGDPNATSADFVIIRALVDGTTDYFMGMTFITSTRIPQYTAGKRYALCYHPSVAVAGQNKLGSDISLRPDRSLAKQLYVKSALAASRLYEDRIVRIENDDLIN